MQRQQLSGTLSSDDESISRVLIHSAEQTSSHTLPLNIIPSSTIVKTTRRTIQTQTIEEIQSSFPSKSIPSFAETQLLSVYYPSQNPKNPSNNDKCVFIEQQDRQPIRYRLVYDPSSSTKSTQTSPSLTPLSTQGSTLILDGNEQKDSKYNQYLKIHSGSQRFSTNFNDEYSSSDELIEQSKYSYEEYIVNLNENQTRTPSSSSSSSVTTVIAQNEEFDSDINEEKANINNNQRISSWPPVPDEILFQNENDEQKRPSRVQFAEQLVHVIPVSTTNSLNEESLTPPAIIPRKSLNDIDSRYPINQSKWIKTHMDNTDIQISSTSNRVDTLRSFFEQSSTLNSPINQNQRFEPEEKPSKHGVEIRFRVNDPNTSNIYHAEPAKVIQHTEKSSIPIPQSTSPFSLDQIRQITGKQLKNLDDIGHYLPDGHTWQWNEIFWLSLTISQRDQLKDLEQKVFSRQNSLDNSLTQSDLSSSSSSNETKRFKSTINITGAGAWQQNKPQISKSGTTKYTEVNTIDENQTSMNIFSSTPNSKIDSQESIDSSINQTKTNDSQITIIESGYSSADDQQKFRPISSTIIEESLHPIENSSDKSIIDPLSYEEFIIDYLSTYGKHIRSNNGTLIIFIDGQQIPISNISLPSSNENIILEKNIYLDVINQDLVPFETELNQLVIFISGESIILPSDRWIFYRKKYHNAEWIKKLNRINRNIPSQLIPIIEEWLSNHAILELDTHKLNIDGLMIPLIGRLGLHIVDLYQIQQLQTNSWSDILKYLIRIGYVSYDSNEKLISIANSELDVQRLLKSPSSNESIQHSIDKNHIEFITQWLDQLNQQKPIDITEENDIIIYLHDNQQQIFIKHEHVNTYMEEKFNSTDVINMNDIAHILVLYNYVQYSSNQWIYNNQNIQLDTNEFLWLQTIIHSIRIIEHTEQTEIELFDGQNTQILQIPYQHMSPTKNSRIIANYLFQNGTIRYDDKEKQYAYRYLPPDEKTKSIERSSQHELLSSYIRHIHIDKIHQKIEIEFTHDRNHLLQLPFNWYQDILKHNFDRLYIIDMLLNNGKILNNDTFFFNNHSYLLKLSSEEKDKLIDYYVEFINNQDGIQYDNKTNLLLLENPLDGSELYLTSEHTKFIQKNQYRRQDMKYILNKYSQIEQDEFDNWLLYYNNQCIQIPSIDQSNEQVHINHSQKIIDPKLKLIFPFNKSLRLIQKTPSTTTLDIQQPNEENDYAIDPLLILANYIHRAGTIYQDEFGRLVIKLYKDEIVIPGIQAINSIQAINISPNRTGTIIARLIHGIGKVQSNKNGGLIITIGKNSIELSKDIIDQSKTNLNISNENLTLNTSSIIRSKSSSSIGSIDDQRISQRKKSSSQTSLSLKPHFLIIHGDENNRTTRFYMQYTYEYDQNSTTVMMLPSRYPVQPTQPYLIAPEHYRDMALRDASVHVYSQGENEVYYENLAQYLSTEQTDLSSRTVRRMLKFSSRDEYFAYLNNKISAIKAEQLVQESEESRSETPDRELHLIEDKNQQRSKSPVAFYNVQNGTMINKSNIYNEQQEHYNFSSKAMNRSSSTSSRSPQTIHSQNLTTPEKNITLPRSTTLSGQSNDGESESRVTVSRSASAAAKVATSKSDTIKSTTSSSAASSREHPVVSSSSTVVRTQSLVSPNRTSGSKGAGDEPKKEKKSKFRTPSFLRKRKEKKEAANKDKAEK